MPIRWLIEDQVFEDDAVCLVDELRAQFFPVDVHPCSDFNPRELRIGTPTFCYGSLQWIKQIQEFKSRDLVTICNFPNFECSKYYAYFGPYLLNRDYMMMPWVEFKRRFRDVIGGVFVRPSSGFKTGSVSGDVFTQDNFSNLCSFFDDMGGEALVVVAPVQLLKYEWRVIIDGQTPIAGSQYKSFCPETGHYSPDFDPSCPKFVFAYAAEVARNVKWSPDPIYVMDIAQLRDDERLAVVEINAISTSGWYDCDVRPIIKAIDHVLRAMRYCGGDNEERDDGPSGMHNL